MKRWELINILIRWYELNSYLEIGVFTRENFNQVQCKSKHSVDPQFDAIFRMTSDQFFSTRVDKHYDIAFVDGLHTEEQTYKDITNCWFSGIKYIIVHDCNPATEWHTRDASEYKRGEEWNGTTYRGFIRFKNEHPDMSCFTIDMDYGCGVITQRPMLKNITHNVSYDWDYFNANRVDMLQLISVDQFRKLL